MSEIGGIERKLLAAVEQTKGKLKAAAGAINGNEVLQRQGEAQRDRASADIETYRRQDEAAAGGAADDDHQATG